MLALQFSLQTCCKFASVCDAATIPSCGRLRLHVYNSVCSKKPSQRKVSLTGPCSFRRCSMNHMLRSVNFLPVQTLAAPLPVSHRSCSTARAICLQVAPRDFARVHFDPDGSVKLQTKVTRYEAASSQSSKLQTVDLYSMVHIAQPEYYRELQRTLRDTTMYDGVFFELLTSQKNLSRCKNTDLPKVSSKISAHPSASARAKSLNAVAQMQVLDVQQGWIADLTREEASCLSNRRRIHRRDHNFSKGEVGHYPASIERSVDQSQTLWILLKLTKYLSFLLPCPELNVFLVDTLLLSNRLSIPAPLFLFPLLRGDLTAARRLIFSQLVEASTQRRANTTPNDAVVQARNLRAIETIEDGLRRCNFQRIAIVYGAWHSDSLGRLLENTLGLKFVSSSWRDAMTIETAAKGITWTRFWQAVSTANKTTDRLAKLSLTDVPFVALSFVLLLFVSMQVYGAFDWLSQIRNISELLEARQRQVFYHSVAASFLYYAKHISLYALLRKWFLFADWDNMNLQ